MKGFGSLQMKMHDNKKKLQLNSAVCDSNECLSVLNGGIGSLHTQQSREFWAHSFLL